MNFEGVLGRKIVLHNDFVEIKVTGFIEKSLGIPSVKFNYDKIASIELKREDFFKKGFIHFTLSGSGF